MSKTNRTNYDVIIIGGGAAGLMAGAICGQNGKDTLIVDKNNQLGRKLLITGKGRCNITNDCDNNTFLQNIPTNSKFLYSAINQFDTFAVKNFFEENGVPLKTERGNRVFPQSDKAIDVCNALINACKKSNVDIITDNIVEILSEDNVVKGVECKSKDKYFAKSVILCTGGKSYPQTGSTGDGYSLAKKLGHTVTKIRPSLVAIASDDEFCKEMQGLSLKNVTLSLVDNEKNKVIFSELGEMLFTHFGISGPLVLSASSHMKEITPNKYKFLLDLKPGLTTQQLDARILRDFDKYINKDFFNGLGDLLPKKMIKTVIDLSKINPLLKINQITKEQRLNLIDAIKMLPISIKSFRSIDEAIITSGGIKTVEINPKTMQSKIIEGLFFAGEIIDVDGYTGGFNLQIAFSTAYLAANNS
ncbi:MAG: NAD(P)/FAD-dependent oxidoreductase [Oscillospiraceae bacterium]